jgi:hypothetical protein
MNVVVIGHEPRYAHDCPNCTFMGSCGDYDIWVCSNKVLTVDSMIARKGSDGADYFSVPRSVFARMVADSIEQAKALPEWVAAILRVILSTQIGHGELVNAGKCPAMLDGKPCTKTGLHTVHDWTRDWMNDAAARNPKPVYLCGACGDPYPFDETCRCQKGPKC